MQSIANWPILDSFDITSLSGHNSLIKAPIEMIQDDGTPRQISTTLMF